MLNIDQIIICLPIVSVHSNPVHTELCHILDIDISHYNNTRLRVLNSCSQARALSFSRFRQRSGRLAVKLQSSVTVDSVSNLIVIDFTQKQRADRNTSIQRLAISL